MPCYRAFYCGKCDENISGSSEIASSSGLKLANEMSETCLSEKEVLRAGILSDKLEVG